MAIYHLSIKTIGRSEGRSATAAAAYRAADKITDERTGEMHDYTRKGGVSYTEIVLPDNAPTWATNRAELWNAAEQSETRKNSTVAREFEIALPSELSEKERQRLAVDFAKEIVTRHNVAADIAIHEPSRGGDNKNHHAHILITTRQLEEDGFTKKTRELDDRKSGEIDRWRERFAELQNERLKQNGVDETVDHRTLKAQGIEREPSKHLGVEATNYERRTGNKSNKRLDFEQQAAERLKAVTEIKELEREARQLEQAINETKAEAVPLKVARGNQAWNSYYDKKAQEQAEKERQKKEDQERKNREEIARLEQVERDRKKLYEQVKAERQEWEKKRIQAELDALPPEQRASKLIADYTEQARNQWRTDETNKIRAEAQKLRDDAQKLQANEPEKPKLFGRAEWEKNHAELEFDVRMANKKARELEEGIGWRLSMENKNKFEYEGMQRLKKEDPELYKTWQEARQQRQKEEERQRQAQKQRKPQRGRDEHEL